MDATFLPTTRDRLLAVAELVDAAAGDHPHGVLVAASFAGDDVVLGVRPLHPDVHPTVELARLTIEPRWEALCLSTHGRARFLDEPDRPPEPIVSTYALARDGTSVSLLRRGATCTELPGPALGRIPDLLRALLDRSTPAAEP